MLKLKDLLGIFCFFGALIGSLFAQAPRIMLGIDVLEEMKFQPLWGKRVGLLTHPAGVNRFGKSTVEILAHAPKVKLVALFGPEHGVHGNEKAEIEVRDCIDKRTGVPVFSLYGKNKRPTPQMLKGIDAMVVDLQDVGVRSYTYISCLRYTMEACFEKGIEVIILDRPNPLGGQKVSGPLLDKEWMSYVGTYRIPYVYGLTIAELARFAKDNPEQLPEGSPKFAQICKRGKLRVIPMKGWQRSMLWPDTGLRWVPTSPNVPDFAAAVGYAMVGLGCQLGGFSHGIGTPYPFRLIMFSKRPVEELQGALERLHIPGLGFRKTDCKDKHGNAKSGIYVIVNEWDKVELTELSFWMMWLSLCWQQENPFRQAKGVEKRLFNVHVGSTRWWDELCQKGRRADIKSFLEKWKIEARAFKLKTCAYWIYQN